MAFVGPVTLLGRVIRRLRGIGWTRAAGNLAFTSLLGLVPLVTVAFAFVAQFPVFQDFVRLLENYLLRYTLPETAAELVRTYVVGMAEEAAKLRGVWILFVIVTAALVVDAVESEINAIWRIDRKRPILRRVLVYTIGVTAGPAMLGAAIWLIRGVILVSVQAVALDTAHIANVTHVVTFGLATAVFTFMYWIAPACKVRWRHALVGGVLAAVAFEATRAGFTWYVAYSPSYEILYGALAALPVFMLWVYIFWLIVLAGAAITASIADE
ncbi:MAG: YihY family inner membrane protein [Burkholderiales bacterium]|nr:YihY family inner membrane protein [Burkholderiales bacterium]